MFENSAKIVVHMTKLGGNQSERRKDNGPIVLWGHVNQMDQSEGGIFIT